VSVPCALASARRFLRRYHLASDTSNRRIPWQLRFPRVAKWSEATDGVVPDTVESFTLKAMAAFAHEAAQGEGQRAAERARTAAAAAAAAERPNWPALEHRAEAVAAEPPRPGAAAAPPQSQHRQHRRTPTRAPPPAAEQDWDTDDSAEEFPKWQEEQRSKRPRT